MYVVCVGPWCNPLVFTHLPQPCLSITSFASLFTFKSFSNDAYINVLREMSGKLVGGAVFWKGPLPVRSHPLDCVQATCGLCRVVALSPLKHLPRVRLCLMNNAILSLANTVYKDIHM